MIGFIGGVVVAAAVVSPPAGMFGWVCPTLDRNPTADGMWDVIGVAVARGQTSDAAAEQILIQVRDVCPEYIPLVLQWADANG